MAHLIRHFLKIRRLSGRIAALAASLGLAIPLPSLAQVSIGWQRVQKIGLDNKIDAREPRDYILTALQILTYLIAAIALFAIVYGGFLYISSAGDEGQAKKGKTTLLYAVIGLLIVGLAAVIVNAVGAIAR